MLRHFRVITSDDYPGLLVLWRETWAATYGPSLGQAALNKMLDEIAQNGTASFFPGSGERGYCIADGQDIQASAIVAERGHVAYLWGMYVRPNCQRQGLGSILIKGAVSNIVTAADIEVRVLPTSPWALNFYRKLGFVDIGTEAIELPSGSQKCLILSAKVEKLRALPEW